MDGHLNFATEANDFFLQHPKESTVCIFCHGDSPTIDLFSTENFTVTRCRCGHVYNSKRPSRLALNEFYRSSRAIQLWAEMKETKESQALQAAKFKKSWEYVKRQEFTSVLDIGCGNGYFLCGLPQVPYRRGVDLNTDALQFLKEKDPMILTFHGPYQDALTYKDPEVDLLTAFGVLEHLTDPHNFLDLARLKAKNILVGVPNQKSKVHETLGPNCYSYCPQHLHHFHLDTLERLFDNCGYRPIEWWTEEAELSPVAKWKYGIGPYRKDLPDWVAADIRLLEGSVQKRMRPMDGYKIFMAGERI